MNNSLRKMLTAAVAATLAAPALADALPVVEVFGHNERDNFGLGFITDMINGSGMNTNGVDDVPGWPTGAGDPSTWVTNTDSWHAEWQSRDLLGDGEENEDLPTNNKIGWVIFDLGSATTLDELYIWYLRERSDRVATNFNVYVADTPTVTPVHGPTNGSSIDYDFSTGGWTSIATGLAGTHRGDEVVDLLDTTGRYVALEIITNGGDGERVGFAEIGITASGGLTGDFDGDGDVDGVDVAEMFANFNGPGGGAPTNPATDLDNDGDVDGVDIAQLFGVFTGPLAPASVPEPAGLALMGVGGLLMARRRR